MARRFSMERGMALRSGPGRSCGLGTPRLGGRVNKPATAGGWCRAQAGSRRGRGVPPRCAHT